MLEVRGVHKSYGDTTALTGLDLALAAGEITALLGPNGAGKTTLISCIAGLLRPDKGSITVDGVDVATQPEQARDLIGLAPQDTGVYEALTVRENLQFFAELNGLRGTEARTRIDEIAGELGLDDLIDRSSQLLSGGEKRRLHTALALVSNAPLLLLDEPTVGADITTRTALLDVVRRLADQGTAVLYSTHYFPEVHQLGASVAIIDHGQLVVSGTINELVTAHAEAAIELEFEGDVPQFDFGRELHRSGGLVRMAADHPATDLAGILARLGPATEQLSSIELIQPDLDTVFLSLTGRRYDADESGHAIEPAPDGEVTP